MMLGILCGLESEARIARRIPGAVVSLSAAEAARAEAEAEKLAALGCTALLSFGVAGGLDPALQPGDALVGTEVLSANGRWQADPVWSASLAAANPFAGGGLVWSAPHMVAEAAEKKILWDRTGAAVVDMESEAVARVAAAHGLPFAVLRTVVDRAGTTLPAAARFPARPNGTPDLPALLGSLLRHPGQLPDLIRLGQNMGEALKALSLYRVVPLS